MDTNNQPEPQQETPLKTRLLEECITYVYVMMKDDDGTLEWLQGIFQVSEEELEKEFINLSNDFDFTLEKKVDGVWESHNKVKEEE